MGRWQQSAHQRKQVWRMPDVVWGVRVPDVVSVVYVPVVIFSRRGAATFRLPENAAAGRRC
jgi:hypothetical protein